LTRFLDPGPPWEVELWDCGTEAVELRGTLDEREDDEPDKVREGMLAVLCDD